MSKYEFLKSESIIPLHKTLSLEYEKGYNGELKTVEFNVYPFTVKEKLEIQNMYNKAKKLLESKSKKDKEDGIELSKDIDDKSTYFILRKDDPETTMDIVKKLPIKWKEKLMLKAMEFEGVSPEDAIAQKKEVNEN